MQTTSFNISEITKMSLSGTSKSPKLRVDQCLITTGFYLGFLWILKNFESHAVARKICFRPSREVQGHVPLEKFEKIVLRIG